MAFLFLTLNLNISQSLLIYGTGVTGDIKKATDINEFSYRRISDFYRNNFNVDNYQPTGRRLSTSWPIIMSQLADDCQPVNTLNTNACMIGRKFLFDWRVLLFLLTDFRVLAGSMFFIGK
ncbi:hypothetical protein DW103_12715 [Parabacteroides sp. AM08-6]|nr:hypothetical protein DW103_12715 [Parabacteroides sp. AM08-6]